MSGDHSQSNTWTRKLYLIAVGTVIALSAGTASALGAAGGQRPSLISAASFRGVRGLLTAALFNSLRSRARPSLLSPRDAFMG
jgi:hypothetical protein